MGVAGIVHVFLPLLVFAVVVYLLLRFLPWPSPPFLDRQKKKAVIIDIVHLSQDTRKFRLSLGSRDTVLGLPIGKHLVMYCPNPPECINSGLWNGVPDPDRGAEEIDRKY